jgi:putative aldouronate transport system permease protein
MRLMHNTGLMFGSLGFTTAGYRIVFNNPNIRTGYMNTFFYVGAGTAVSMLVTAMAAFVLSRKTFLWRREVMLMITFTMFFSGGMIPSFLLVRNLGLIDTRWAIIWPSLLSTMNIIIMRTGMGSVPVSLEESAYLDGANEWTIFWRIIVPLSKASLAVITLYYTVSNWNSWFHAAIYLRRRSLFPLQLILREILIQNDPRNMLEEGMADDRVEAFFIRELVKYCTIIIATVPILCAYPFIQKYFVKGVMIGSIKE